MNSTESELHLPTNPDSLPTLHNPSSIQILEAAVRGGITKDNVAVVKELIAMRREEQALQNKVSFNRAFFRLKQQIARMDFYADKAAYNGNDVAYTYCSEAEISTKLEPVLFEHGFAMMFGQRQEADRVVAEVTLIHEDGHEEKREYSVRVGSTNKMKDATAVDSGSTTSAWRHLVMKLFGLKSRIREESDVRNEGEKISWEQCQYLDEQLRATNSDKAAFLKFAGAPSIPEIMTNSYDRCVRALEAKARK